MYNQMRGMLHSSLSPARTRGDERKEGDEVAAESLQTVES